MSVFFNSMHSVVVAQSRGDRLNIVRIPLFHVSVSAMVVIIDLLVSNPLTPRSIKQIVHTDICASANE